MDAWDPTYAQFEGGRPLDLDPCTNAASDCYAQVETASDAGAWLSACPYDDTFELDLDRVFMRRHHRDGQVLVEVAGEELFGTGEVEHTWTGRRTNTRPAQR